MSRDRKDDEWFTVAEASGLKKISPDGVRAAIRAKRLPAVEKSFGYLIRGSDLKAWKPRGWKPEENA